jgi:hypothetical protein
MGKSGLKGEILLVKVTEEFGEEEATTDSSFMTKALESVFPLSFLLAMMALQKFTSEEIKN